MSTIKERISQIIDYKGMNAYSFEKYCELANGYIKSINVDVGSTKLERILRKFPEISPAWLILGEGPMFISQASQEAEEEENQAKIANSEGNRALNNPKKYDFDLKEEIVQLRHEMEQVKALLQVKDDEINFYRSTIASALTGKKDEE